MNLENMYQEIILDHYKHPHGKGLVENAAAEVHHVNPTCGDEITLQVTPIPGTDKFNVHYQNQGCSISQASASILFDQLDGKSLAEGEIAVEHMVAMMQRAEEPNEDLLGDGIALVGVASYPARVKCALLSWMAWKDAVIQAQGNSGPSGAVDSKES
jgi:nitrogen fixation NifU-like protein